LQNSAVTLYPQARDDKMAKAKDIFAAALQIVHGAAVVYITKREVSDETGSRENARDSKSGSA
jgi:hypothetical protein